MMHSMNRDYSEKRDFIRMKVDSEVHLSTEGSTHSITGICRDLSGTGMLIEVQEEIAEETVLYSELPSSNPAFPALKTKLLVKRCTPATQEGHFLLGTEIQEKS